MAKESIITFLNVSSSTLNDLPANTTKNEPAILESNGSSAEDKVFVINNGSGAFMSVGPPVIPHTWTVEGTVETKTLPGMIPYITTHRKAKVLAIKGKLSAGTATVAIKRGSTTIATMNLTTSVSSGSLSNTDLANDEELYVQITAASSATNLSVTVHIRYY